ncbi:hypothetical protein, partial [Microcoleus sp. ARI1-A3]|uniref:hypothetical protein n=1 Tax=Microcoleus sp. ARI1-A3 TaxID=2818558 RepID=UPI002FCEC3FD
MTLAHRVSRRCVSRDFSRQPARVHLLGDGLVTYRYDSQGRMESASTGSGVNAPTTQYAHNALGQRVFKTEPLYSPTGKQGSA